MSLRAYTDHVDDYDRTHTLEIHKQGYGGSADYLKNTGEGYASFDYEKIDPKNPTENPIQKGALEFSLWLQSSTLIDEIKTADEQTFWAIHKIDGSQEWQGYIYNDLSTYEEGFDGHPFRITLMAKDFTDLGGKDYKVSGSLPDSREEVIKTIAYLLNTVGFSIPIKTHTSWIEENLEAAISGDYDYLNQIYHETKALRNFGRTGDEEDTAITVEEALNKLCVNHGLLLKQSNGCYWIDQLTEYDDPTNVQEAEYDLTGSQSSLTTGNDLTVSANTSDLKVTIQEDNRDNSGLPGLKRVTNKFKHRTKINNIKFPRDIVLNGGTESYSQFFVSDGDQKIRITGSIEATMSSGSESSITASIQINPTGYIWNGTDWSGSSYDITLNLIGPDGSGGYVYGGSFAETTDNVPSDADGTLTIKFFSAGTATETASRTEYNADIDILNPVGEKASTSINYELTQTGGFSVEREIRETWYGDGPIGYAVSALRYSSSDGDTTSDSWQRRGLTSYRNFHENRLKEDLDIRRGWRRLLHATLKGKYYAWQILNYDSEYFYFLGGSWDLWTGNWEGELFAIDVQTGSDTFEDIPKYTDETGSGSGSSGGSSGGGLDQSTADARYFKKSSNLSEGDPATMRGNLFDDLNPVDDDLLVYNADTGDWEADILGGSSALDTAVDQGVVFYDADIDALDTETGFEYENSTFKTPAIEVNGTNLFPTKGQEQALGTGDDVTHKDGTFTGALRGNTLRTDTGKFLSPVSYTFRNAGDTGYRDVQMAGLTATTGTFSDILTANANIDANDDIKLDDANTNITTDTFASGFAGSGMAFLQDGTWDGTLDNLTVRQRLRVYELLINQIRATNGSLVVTSATKTGRQDDLGFSPVQQVGGTLDWTSTDPFWTETDQYWYRTYRVYIEENQLVPFVEDDLVLSQRFTGGGTYLVEGTVVNVENGSATATDNSTRRYFDINLTADSDIPQSGMDFVRWGNLSDPDRQGVLYLTADDDDAPYMDIVYGMDAHSKRNSSGTVKGRIGRLDGIVDSDFPTLDGTQTNEFGVYINGGYFNNVEVRGTVTILDEDASNAATKDYVNNATSAAGNQIIRATSAPSTRTDGSALVEGDTWIDTDDGDKPYTYDGSGFVAAYTAINGGDITTGTVNAARVSIGASTTYASGYNPSEKSFTIRNSSEPSQRPDGTSLQAGDIWIDTDDGDKPYTYDGSSFVQSYTIIDGGNLTTGSVTANKLDVNDLSAVSANIDGTLTMGANGDITNTNNDYSISDDGIYLVKASSSSTGSKKLRFVESGSGTSVQANIWYTDNSSRRLILDCTNEIQLNADTDIFLDSDPTGAVHVINELDVGGFVTYDTTSEPSAPSSGASVYVDSNDGDLKVKFANGTIKTIATN